MSISFNLVIAFSDLHNLTEEIHRASAMIKAAAWDTPTECSGILGDYGIWNVWRPRCLRAPSTDEFVLQELASSTNIMRLTQEKTHWKGPGVLLISAVVQNATERLEKPSSNAAMQLNAKNVLDIFHSAAVLGFHPQEGLFLQTVLKMVELRLQEFSAQVQLDSSWVRQRTTKTSALTHLVSVPCLLKCSLGRFDSGSDQDTGH